jgi:hypothetical protein
MFEQAPEWVSRSPRIRKTIIKIWRIFLRMQRATLANAVLVMRRTDDRVLAVDSPSGLGLPSLELSGWRPVGMQVQEWVDRISGQPSAPGLRAVDGAPGQEGVTFLYSADIEGASPDEGYTWLEAELASSALSERDRRLLRLSIDQQA